MYFIDLVTTFQGARDSRIVQKLPKDFFYSAFWPVATARSQLDFETLHCIVDLKKD